MWVIAHRGASAFAPENTLAAFRRAVEMGAEFIETDLQLSRDGTLVAIHDETLDRTTNGSGPVSAMPLRELRQLDAGGWFNQKRADKSASSNFAGERIPTIDEVLAFGRENDIGLFLEIKSAGDVGTEHVLAGALRAADEINRTVVLGFDATALTRVREFDPLVVTGLLYSRKLRDPVAKAVGVGARHLLPRSDRITPQLVAQAHRSDLKVVTWTVNAPEQMRAMIAAGVDGIITDYPNELVRIVSGG
jgi:glycerophosphoryl diester phosphodiesterase